MCWEHHLMELNALFHQYFSNLECHRMKRTLFPCLHPGHSAYCLGVEPHKDKFANTEHREQVMFLCDITTKVQVKWSIVHTDNTLLSVLVYSVESCSHLHYAYIKTLNRQATVVLQMLTSKLLAVCMQRSIKLQNPDELHCKRQDIWATACLPH